MVKSNHEKYHLFVFIGYIVSFKSKGPSFIGGEIHSKQTFGFGTYTITMKASEGIGSITGFFNLCYSDTNYTRCLDWNPEDRNHLETDVEFTPTGNNPQSRTWIRSCLSDDACETYHPNPAPRNGKNSLKAISFNTYPNDNQTYYALGVDPYQSFNTYTMEVLPEKIIWYVNGKAILSREKNAVKPVRRFPPYWDNFNSLLENKKIKMIVNLWDGSQGGNGGFGGASSISQTSGKAVIQRMAYYPATCPGGQCTIETNPSFEVDFNDGDFVLDNQKLSVNKGDSLCSGATSFFDIITRSDYPVYVNPNNVKCKYEGDGIELYYKSN